MSNRSKTPALAPSQQYLTSILPTHSKINVIKCRFSELRDPFQKQFARALPSQRRNPA